jgi:acetyl-CoA C-acetyltransferase
MENKAVYIVDGTRTPYLKARDQPGPFSASDLAVAAGRELLLRQPFERHQLGEVILGCVMPRENEANIARVVSLRLGCGAQVPAWTVQRNCGSGMQALDSAMKDIVLGRYDLVLAGGTEAMSHAPFLFNDDMIHWMAKRRAAQSWSQKLALLTQFKQRFLTPVIALLRGLTDPIVGLNMGQTAEILAHEFHITRQQMDEFALRSHQRLVLAQESGHLAEITPLYDRHGHCYQEDTGLRRDTSLDKLAALKPFFDKPFGAVTAGNSSQVTDGAALLILASETAVKRYQLPVLGRIVDVQWAALSPQVMGLGPVFAVTPLLQRHKLSLSDIDYWEINEAFAAQVLACLAAWQSDEFCRQHLNLPEALGTFDLNRLNVDGGAIALGHPVGASGARIVLHLLEVLRRTHTHRGMAAICIGGGQGGAMLIEREP